MDLTLQYFLLLSTGFCFATNDSQDVKITVLKEHSCSLSDLDIANPTSCAGVEDGGLTVRHQGYCLVNINGTETFNSVSRTIFTCDHGHWSGTDSSVGKNGRLLQRRKRYFFEILAALFIVCFLFCEGGGWGGGTGGGGGGDGGSDTRVHTKYPPSFNEPCMPGDVQYNYNVSAGDSVTVISWTEPVATDRDGGVPSVNQVDGGANGGKFKGATYGKTHYITYKATDSDGLTGHCHFSFTVTLLTCNVLPWPDHGAKTCDSNILGGSCYYTCDPGYQLSGSNTVTCENHMSPTWSQIPTCEEIKCSSPSYPANSTVRCSDLTYPYQSICTIHCDHGFSMDGPVYMQCQADGTWSNVGLSKCDSPPTITCITPQLFYADRALTTTSVTWTEPTALDNTDPHPTIVKTDGPSIGAVLQVGREIVQYKAIDSEGNESPKCTIELLVEEITCCHPMDSFNDTFLVFNCTKPRYTYGTSCTLSCLAHLPLEGASMLTCEDNGKSRGIWDWGNDGRPYCKEISCPELDPPVNGALVRDSIQTRPVYTMTCNEQYDIPKLGSNFNGMFFCKDQGGWTPFEYAPDCTEPKSPRFLNLPAEIFYYSGDCGTNETMAEIKRHFQVILVNHLKPYFESICPTGETCSAENIEIQCGRIQSRTKRSLSLEYNAEDFRKLKHYLRDKSRRRGHSVQKRQTETHLLVLKFNIVVALDVDNSTLRDAIGRYDDIQLNILKPAVQEMVNNGTFDLDGFVLKNDSFQTADYGEIKCDPGYELDDTKCKPCPVGYSWNNTKCEQCPIGQYKDIESEISCSNCPIGFSTKKTGTKSLNDCKKLCRPGSYSPDTMESCSPCIHGYYQDEYGQTSCNVCPAGTTTESTNSSSITDCRSYDVLLKNTNGEVNVSTILATMNSLTFMFWSKQFNDQPSDVVFSLRSDGAGILDVHVTEAIRVEIPSQMNETVGLHSSTSWKHLAVTWDTIYSRITVYVGGESVYIKEAVIAPNVPLIDNGALIVKGSGPTGVFLSGLHLLAKVLPDSDVANHSTSCYVIENEDIVNIDAFDGFEKQGITITTSSQSIDECSPSPCNGHLCTNGNDNFTCTCLGGWSGTTCTIPPRVFDGGWSEWTSWTECSQSCGSGTQSRTRNCDSPSPDTYGKDCMGNSTERSSCNVNDCPVCAELHRQFGSPLNCSIDPMSGMLTCVLYCEKGRFLPPGLRDFQTYTCGPGTNYDWDPLDSLPNCVEPLGPRNASIGVSLNYTSVISDSSKQTVVDAVSDNLEATPCHNDPNCQTEVEITKSNDISVSTVYVTFSIPLLLGPDMQYDAYISDGILSDALQELQSAILNLESTAKYIQNYTSEIYDVTSNDVSVFADSSSLTFEAMLRCDSGYAVQDGFCLRCPFGTHSDNGACSFCGKGTYQENTGQTSCSRCPSGLTTSTIGSSNISQCTEEKVKVATISPTSESTASILVQSEDKETLFITMAIAGSGLLFAVAAICVVAWCKIRRSNPKQIGVVIDMKIECKSGCTMVYKKARPADTLPLTPSPVKPVLISMTDCDMFGSEAAVTPDMWPHVAKMPPTDRPHVTVTGDIDEPHFYDLPEYIENDDHTYSNIYEE